MKNKLFFLLILCITKGFSQNQVINIIDDNGEPIHGAYYKDIDSLLNPFVGRYVFDNGQKRLKFVLQKMIHSSMSGVYFEDLIVGEFEYSENGVLITSTLNNFNYGWINGAKHNISGNLIVDKPSGLCDDCLPGEKALHVGYVDPYAHAIGSFTIRRMVMNGQDAIHIDIGYEVGTRQAGEPVVPLSIRGREFVLIKQP
jgi:hypothetical protein